MKLTESDQRGNRDANEIGKYCGANVPGSIHTNLDLLSVEFLSDASVAGNGFRLEWVIDGCGGILKKNSGTFTSPDYPNVYPINVICEWKIESDPGTKINLTIAEFDLEGARNCQYDSLTVYAGPDDTSPVLSTLCSQHVFNVSVESLGNHMFVRFKSDGSIRGKGFSASFQSQAGGCGARMTAPTGSIHSPNYPNTYDSNDDCAWSIEVDPTHRIQFTFIDFDVEPHANCSYDYVALYDGASTADPLLLQHCGQDVPHPNVIFTTSNRLYVRMKTDGSQTSKGFLANYTRACGARIVTDGSGDLMSPHYPHAWEDGGECLWTIIGASPSDRVTFTLTDISLPSRENCSEAHLSLYDGETTDSPLIGRFCSQTIPHQITTQGTALTVQFEIPHDWLDLRFRALYTVEDTACGGALTSLSGRFASPNFPNAYPQNTECVWEIGGWPGNQITLQFESFQLESSENCNRDYVEIHEGSEEGRLLGLYCGSNLPTNITTGIGKLWVKFNSDTTGIANGFSAFYSLVYGQTEISGDSGQIVSPLFPAIAVTGHGVSSWIITVDEDSTIFIDFDTFELEVNGYEDGGCLSELIIYDGFDASAPELLRQCGSRIPGAIVSTGNGVFIKLQLGRAHEGSRFKLNWRKLNAASRFRPLVPNNDDQCVNEVYVNASNTTYLTSPNYPRNYPDNYNCDWVIRSDPLTRIQITVMRLSMESSRVCRYDALSVFDGMYGTQRWNLTDKLCRRSQQSRVYTSSGNYMKLNFKTDRSISRGGWRIKVKAICGGYIYDSAGTITSPNYPENYGDNLDCTWRIQTRRGRTFSFYFDALNVTSANTDTCDGDYLMLRNGVSDTSPLMLIHPGQSQSQQNGRLCGSQRPARHNSTSNVMSLRFHSDGSGSASGFKFHFRQTEHGCGGHVRLTETMPEIEVSSPNHPNMPPAHSECIWNIMAPPEHRIQADFVERFDIRPSSQCRLAGVELKDGGTDVSPLIGTFCNFRPDTQKSSSNVMRIKYYTNSDRPNLGFKAKVSLAKCGGTIHVTPNSLARIHSPLYPAQYPINSDCIWTLIGPQGHYLQLNFDELDLPDAGNCSTTDHIEILEPVLNSNTSIDEFTVTKTICGNANPASTQNTGTFMNLARVRFVSNSVNRRNVGFVLAINASVESCGGDLQGASGAIQTPGYPHGYPHHHRCRWAITGPPGRRIKLTFEDFDLEPATANFYPASNQTIKRCEYDYVYVFSGSIRRYRTPAFLGQTSRCGADLPQPVSSTSNVMMIGFKSDGSVSHRGFKATWSSEEMAVCGGIISGESGIIQAPLNENFTYPDQTYCHWTLAPRLMHGTLKLSMDSYYLENPSHEQCHDDLTFIRSDVETGSVLASVCGHFNEQKVILSPGYVNTHIIFSTDLSITDRGFNISYSYNNCGGVYTGPSTQIRSSGTNEDCVWKLEYQEGQQIELSGFRLVMENSATIQCGVRGASYVIVRNGGEPDSPVLWTGCGNTDTPRQPIRSMSNQLWIESHLQGAGHSFSFNAVADQDGCGGVLHGQSGNITAPLGSDGKYRHGIRCSWDIEAQPGYRINVAFSGRFDIEQNDGCNNDYVQIVPYDEAREAWQWTKAGKFCGRQLPYAIPNLNNAHRLRVIFRSNNDVNGDGFNVRKVPLFFFF